MDAIRQRIQEAKDNLAIAANDREYDLILKGMIVGLDNVLNIQIDVVDNNDDESKEVHSPYES